MFWGKFCVGCKKEVVIVIFLFILDFGYFEGFGGFRIWFIFFGR